jgi:hypothetical protein
MANWITSDATGVTIHIPPLPDPPELVLWLGAAAIALALLLALLKARHTRAAPLERLAASGATFLGSHASRSPSST